MLPLTSPFKIYPQRRFILRNLPKVSSSPFSAVRGKRRGTYHAQVKVQRLHRLKYSSSSSLSSSSSSSSSLLRILPEVQTALKQNKPVVALESTILAHGLPYPENITLAKEVSSIIRQKGAIPATIAIDKRDGSCRVGLTEDELEDLAKSEQKQQNQQKGANAEEQQQQKQAEKCTTRDLPFHIARKRIYKDYDDFSGNNCWGATTVASTMHIAHRAGITTFVTGGTGGVHRGAEKTMDVSADLFELSRTPVIVVSAGVKSILDIPKTLEVLETYSVPVASYRTNYFPAFFSPTSGIKSPARVDTAEEIAEAFRIAQHSSMKMNCGMLIAVPNPDSAIGKIIENAIQESLEEAKNNPEIEIGKDVTPFLLKRVAEKTNNESLNSNTLLVKNNASVGADIAVAICNNARSNDNDPILYPTREDSARVIDHIRGDNFNGNSPKNNSHSTNHPSNDNNNSAAAHHRQKDEDKEQRIIDALKIWKAGVTKTSSSSSSSSFSNNQESTYSFMPVDDSRKFFDNVIENNVEERNSSGTLLATTKPEATTTNRNIDNKTNGTISSSSSSRSKVIVMGGSVIDLVAKPNDELILGTSNPGTGCRECDGGVGRNIAEVLMRLGSTPTLYTAIGDDSRGNALIQRMDNIVDRTEQQQHVVNIVNDANTATYLAVLNSDGDLHTAIADMNVLEQIPVPDEEALSKVDYLIVDANPPITSLVKAGQNALAAVGGKPTKVCFEPTSVPKAARVSQNDHFMSTVSYAFPNLDELFALARQDDDAARSSFDTISESNIQAAAKEVLNRCHPVEAHLIITMGANGVLLASKYEKEPNVLFLHFDVPSKSSSPANCTGAGDTLAGAFVHALMNGSNIEEAVTIGMEKALVSLECEERTVSSFLSSQTII